jgi:hypothetical protein
MSKKKKRDATEAYNVTLDAVLEGDETSTAALVAALLDDGIPRMRLCEFDDGAETHREKIPMHDFPMLALVARPVNKAEIAQHPEAQAALDQEWHKLVAAKVWDEAKAYEWSTLARDARETGETIHVGRVFELCTEKGSELPAGDPGRKYKGRSVFQGNQVTDVNWDVAVFQELGLSPAQLAAVKTCDWYGLLQGHNTMQADAEAAYINAELSGTPTYVRLPANRVPAKFRVRETRFSA